MKRLLMAMGFAVVSCVSFKKSNDEGNAIPSPDTGTTTDTTAKLKDAAAFPVGVGIEYVVFKRI